MEKETSERLYKKGYMKFLILLLEFSGLIFSQNDPSYYKKMIDEALKLQESQNQLHADIRIERIKGIVKIITSDEKEIELKDNLQYPLESGDIIKTGYDGETYIYINNTGVIKIERNTELEITETFSPSIFTLFTGAIISKIEKLKNQLAAIKIKTPSAVIGVRGTEFAITHTKFGNKTVTGVFDEGEVAVYPGEEENESTMIKLTKNTEVTISPETKRYKVTALLTLNTHKSKIFGIRKKLLTHKKKWKRFTEEQRMKFRQILYKKRIKDSANIKNRKTNQSKLKK